MNTYIVTATNIENIINFIYISFISLLVANIYKYSNCEITIIIKKNEILEISLSIYENKIEVVSMFSIIYTTTSTIDEAKKITRI